MSVEIKKDITTVTVEVPKTGVAVENAVTNINVQVSQPQLTISQAGVSGRDGTSGTSGTFGNVLSSSLRISGSIIPNVADSDLTSSFSLGSATNAWKDLWISKGTIYFIGDNNQTASISINEDNQISISDINLTGSLTASLKEGYLWVGGPNNITKLIATSSLVTGGTGAGFPFEGNADITGSLNVSGSIFLNGVNITSGGGVGSNGTSGTAGTSGINGTNGYTPQKGVDYNDGDNGTSGIDGTSGTSATAGSGGTSGSSGESGTSGTSAIDGSNGSSGSSGSGGTSGIDGTNGTAGSGGTSGIDGTNGTAGSGGTSGVDGTSGSSGSGGTSGVDGSSGSSGSGGTSGLRGERYKVFSSSSLTLGDSGSIYLQEGLGYSIAQEIIIANDLSHYQTAQVESYNTNTGEIIFGPPTFVTGSGTFTSWTVNLAGAAGGDGTSGTGGSAGTSGTSGSGGSSGTTGTGGSSGSTGSSGTSATAGSGGTSGISGTNGTAGSGGTSGISGTNGTSGISGTNGTAGSGGTSGLSGTSGSSGSGGTSGTNGSTLILTQYSGSVAVTGSLTVSNALISDATLLMGNSSSLTLTSGSNIYIQQNGNLYITGSEWISGSLNITGSITLNGVTYTTLTAGSGSGESGTSGLDGSSGTSGTSGLTITGSAGTSGIDGTSGTSGTSGLSITGSAGSHGTSGVDGTSGTSGISVLVDSGSLLTTSSFNEYSSSIELRIVALEYSASINISGSNGTSGVDGTSGTSGLTITGSAGTSGIDGTSGTSGLTITGSAGSHGTSGTSGISPTTIDGLISSSQQITDFGFVSSSTADTTELNNFTGSIRAEIDGIEAYTASLKATTLISGAAQITALGFGAGGGDVTALNTYTSSNDSVLQRIMQTTASLNIVTGSFTRIWQTTASLNTFTGSIRGEVNGLEAYTASLKAATLISSSTQITNLGLYATLTANSFNGNQIITGSLTVSSTAISEATLFASASNLVLNSGSNLQINNSGLATINNRLQVSGSTILSGSTNLTGSVTINENRIDNGWTAYTPEWTAASSNPAIGDGTIEGYYKVIGKTCFVRGNIAMGSTTTFGTGEWYVSMPFTASHADAILMAATLLDNGTAWYNATIAGARAGFNHKAPIQYQSTGGTADSLASNTPFTWTTGDRFIWNGSYEIA